MQGKTVAIYNVSWENLQLYSILKIIKSIKTILKKIITKKIMLGNIVAINDVLKKKNYKATFSTSSVWKKKFDKSNFEKKSIKNAYEKTL